MPKWRIDVLVVGLVVASCSAVAPTPRKVEEPVERPLTEREADAGSRPPLRTDPPHEAPPPGYGHRVVQLEPDAGIDSGQPLRTPRPTGASRP